MESLPCGLGCGDHFGVQAGADHELRAGLDGVFGFLRGGHGAGAEQELQPCSFLSSFSRCDGAGHGHGDFDDGDAAGDHRFDDGVGLGLDLGAQNGNKADAFDDLCGGFGHEFLSERSKSELEWQAQVPKAGTWGTRGI